MSCARKRWHGSIWRDGLGPRGSFLSLEAGQGRGRPEADPRWPLLLIEAEKIREALSFADSVDWWPRASGLGFGENVSLTIHRDEIEEIISPLVKPAIDLAKEIWDRYNCQKLLLAGGCTRMPLIRRSLGMPWPSRQRFEPVPMKL